MLLILLTFQSIESSHPNQITNVESAVVEISNFFVCLVNCDKFFVFETRLSL